MKTPWMVSLHGGHSGAYCDHAKGTLREILDAAVAAGYHTFGVSEHAPRLGEAYLYEQELASGWSVDTLQEQFHSYCKDLARVATDYAGKLVVLKGFEAEVVPPDRYREIMTSYKKEHEFDYMVGSVHFVDETLIDGPKPLFERAVEEQGGLEALCLRYYELVGHMIEDLQPEVVGHLDLVRKNAPSEDSVDTPRIRQGVRKVLETALAHRCILDVNTAGYRKGLGRPYPAPWILQMALELDIGLCFGDDSHEPGQVGAGIDAGRSYLLANGVEAVEILTKEDGAIVRRRESLV